MANEEFMRQLNIAEIQKVSGADMIERLLASTDFEKLEKVFVKNRWTYFGTVPPIERFENITRGLAEICIRDLTLGSSAYAGRLRVTVGIDGLALECLNERKQWLLVSRK
jgi:hypothetical protein